jgi:hypothetical protein
MASAEEMIRALNEHSARFPWCQHPHCKSRATTTRIFTPRDGAPDVTRLCAMHAEALSSPDPRPSRTSPPAAPLRPSDRRR